MYDFLVDFDTPIVGAAAAQQKNTVLVTFLKNGKQREFTNRTEFKQWLKDNPKWALDQFSVEDKVTVVGSARLAVAGLLQQMDSISRAECVRGVKFCTAGDKGNFRNDIARILPYKGQRPKKPVLFEKIKKSVIETVNPERIIQPTTNIEVDDIVSIYLAQERHLGKKSKRAISFVDKDLKTVAGWGNSFRDMCQPTYTDELEAFKNFAFQGLTGDVSDNILGIPYQAKAVLERFSLKKSNGFGKVSAEKCLHGANTIEDIVDRLTFVYYETFKDGYTLANGTKLTWIDVLDENMQLLKMLDYEGQVYKFSEEFGIKP